MQAARDYEGKGCMEKACDRKDAKMFFFSMTADYVFWRGLWFGLAGVPIPSPDDMGLLVHRLSRAYKTSRREFADRARQDEELA